MGHLVAFWQFFRSNHHFIALIAELARPELLTILLFNKCARDVENGLALIAEGCVTSHELSSILQTFHANLENICVEFNCILFAVFSLLVIRVSLTSKKSEFLSLVSALFSNLLATILRTLILVTEVQITVEIIGVHLLSRRVAIMLDINLDLFFLLFFFRDRCESWSGHVLLESFSGHRRS